MSNVHLQCCLRAAEDEIKQLKVQVEKDKKLISTLKDQLEDEKANVSCLEEDLEELYKEYNYLLKTEADFDIDSIFDSIELLVRKRFEEVKEKMRSKYELGKN